MERRRFLSLCGGGVTGIWLAGTGFIQLTRQMVLKCSRPCSFCGKPPFHAFGLAGIAERDASICDDCTSLCFDIIAEEPHESQRPTSTWTDPDDLDALLRDHVPDESLRRKIELELETARAAPLPRRVKIEIYCAFCDKHQRDVAKLIAGPSVYICDGCIGDAAAILLRPERLA